MANKRTKNEAKRLGIRVTTGTKRRVEKSEKVLSAQVKKKLAAKKKLANMSPTAVTRAAKGLGMRGGIAKAKNSRRTAKVMSARRRKSAFGRKS